MPTQSHSSSAPPPVTLLVALSGPSSSGKTTLARLLHRSILPPGLSTLLHLDDFYKPEAQLPVRDGLVDWDSAGALDLEALERTLSYISTHGGSFPPDFVSKEDGNDVGEVPVSDAVIADLAREVRDWWAAQGLAAKVARIVLVDGFLLLGESIPGIRGLFGVRILLRAAFADAKRRREARSGYVTLEGWWEDPPGYVERVVWPGYVEEHGYLFEGSDVEGDVDEEVARRTGVDVAPLGFDDGLEGALRWTVGVVRRRVEENVEGDGQGMGSKV